jgi:hypothetical protein
MNLWKQNCDPGMLDSNILLANGELTTIIYHNKTRQGYARKRILKLAGYFFLGGTHETLLL